MSFTSGDLELAIEEQRGPLFEWLQRVHQRGGDRLLRLLVLDLVRNAESLKASQPPELVEQYAAWIDNPKAEQDAMRDWLASDGYTWRELAKMAFEWGGSERTGLALVEQTARVLHFHLWGKDPGPDIDALRGRMPELGD